MSILKILEYPDIRLRKIAKPVVKFNRYIEKLIKNMLETMYSKKGIGLAATQININLQIIVINIIDNKPALVFINPKIIKKTGIIYVEEGCLSIPQIKAVIPRYQKIHIQSIDCYGNVVTTTAKSLLSICIQHEIDHLMGILFIDYLTHIQQ